MRWTFSVSPMSTPGHNFTLRLDDALKNRVERRTASLNEKRVEWLTQRGPKMKRAVNEFARSQFTMSDTIRRALIVGLDVLEGDEEAVADWVAPLIEERLKRILARGYSDKESAALLRRIADGAEPDFG